MEKRLAEMTEALRAAAVAREAGSAMNTSRVGFHNTCPACRRHALDREEDEDE